MVLLVDDEAALRAAVVLLDEEHAPWLEAAGHPHEEAHEIVVGQMPQHPLAPHGVVAPLFRLEPLQALPDEPHRAVAVRPQGGALPVLGDEVLHRAVVAQGLDGLVHEVVHGLDDVALVEPVDEQLLGHAPDARPAVAAHQARVGVLLADNGHGLLEECLALHGVHPRHAPVPAEHPIYGRGDGVPVAHALLVPLRARVPVPDLRPPHVVERPVHLAIGVGAAGLHDGGLGLRHGGCKGGVLVSGKEQPRSRPFRTWFCPPRCHARSSDSSCGLGPQRAHSSLYTRHHAPHHPEGRPRLRRHGGDAQRRFQGHQAL
mmetsp:Transcript_29093/g.92856  ORF Transcript_29093/g.92856 Transcript_29093/m.92856 type:complete len:316 (-) Transcript_29093:850-1797(-)